MESNKLSDDLIFNQISMKFLFENGIKESTILNVDEFTREILNIMINHFLTSIQELKHDTNIKSSLNLNDNLKQIKYEENLFKSKENNPKLVPESEDHKQNYIEFQNLENNYKTLGSSNNKNNSNSKKENNHNCYKTVSSHASDFDEIMDFDINDPDACKRMSEVLEQKQKLRESTKLQSKNSENEKITSQDYNKEPTEDKKKIKKFNQKLYDTVSSHMSDFNEISEFDINDPEAYKKILEQLQNKEKLREESKIKNLTNKLDEIVIKDDNKDEENIKNDIEEAEQFYKTVSSHLSDFDDIPDIDYSDPNACIKMLEMLKQKQELREAKK